MLAYVKFINYLSKYLDEHFNLYPPVRINYENFRPNISINILGISHVLSYFKMFTENIFSDLLKYDSACEIS